MTQAVKNARLLIYVLNSGNLYGTERMALATLAGFHDYAKVILLAPPAKSTGSVHEAAEALGYTMIPFRTRREFTFAVIPWLARYRRVDMIGTGVGQSYISYALSIPLCVHLTQLQVAHGGTEAWHAYGGKLRLNRIPVTLIAVSNYVRERLIEHGLRPERIRVIENFIPLGVAKFATRQPFDPAHPGGVAIDVRRAKVAVVSRIDPIKRIDLLVSAVAVGGLDHFEFNIYGTGTELESLRARAAPFRNIKFHGFEADVHQRLAESDLFLHTCPEEPFGLAILEAHRARIVVIVPDTGGPASIIDHGVTGFKFTANDVDALRSVLQRTVALPAIDLQRLVDCGANTLEQRFSPETGVRRYREALGLGVSATHV